MGHAGRSQGGEWETACWSSSSSRGLLKPVVGFPPSTPLVIMATRGLHGSSPEVDQALVQEAMRVEAVE